MSDQRSFTLIELLIVIGILAILVAAVVVILNPAQLLAQARDSKRQQDLSALNQALQTVSALDQSLSFGSSSIVYTSLPDSTTTCATWNLPSLPSGWTYHCVATSTLQNTNGTGWIPVNFQSNGVVSLSALPTDPVNTSSTGLYYTYVSGGSFQLSSHFESSKYQATQGSDAMYTVGSNLSLAPFLSGLVGWWKFDETSGTTTADASGYNNTGIMYASTTPTYILTSSGCKSGNCASFNGIDNQINLPDLGIMNAGTYSFWVRPTSTNVAQGWIDSNFDIFQWSGNIVYFRAGNQSYASIVNWSANTWHQVAMAWDGANYYGYLDGALSVSGAQSGSRIGSLYLGKVDAAYFFSGQIDEARIYKRALSASEIQALYSATK